MVSEGVVNVPRTRRGGLSPAAVTNETTSFTGPTRDSPASRYGKRVSWIVLMRDDAPSIVFYKHLTSLYYVYLNG